MRMWSFRKIEMAKVGSWTVIWGGAHVEIDNKVAGIKELEAAGTTALPATWTLVWT
jgi:hypothetical protein